MRKLEVVSKHGIGMHQERYKAAPRLGDARIALPQASACALVCALWTGTRDYILPDMACDG